MITILMPIYNGIEFIDESVGSIISQTYTNWQLIIGINGHPKDSVVFKRAKEFERSYQKTENQKIKVLDLHEIKGKSSALNEMMDHVLSESPYIALLDVDDIWETRKLETQLPFLYKYDVIGTKCIYIGRLAGIVPNIPTENFSTVDFFTANPLINSSTLIRKQLCFWNPSWDGVEDYDLWLRLRKNDAMFYNCPDILVKHRIHQESAFNANGNKNQVPHLLQTHR